LQLREASRALITSWIAVRPGPPWRHELCPGGQQRQPGGPGHAAVRKP